MSARELALVRDLVARTRLAREAARAIEDEPTWPRLGARCVYCGKRTPARRILTCPAHVDLLLVDPKYAGDCVRVAA